MSGGDRRVHLDATIDAEQAAARATDWLTRALDGLACASRREVERGVDADDVDPIGWVS